MQRIATRLGLSFILAALTISPTHQPSHRSDASELNEIQRLAFHEARLRKLHLVRPDLIAYPIAYDILC